jgi:hypothetical protein
MEFIVRGVPQEIADEVRRTHRSPGYGHPAHLEVAAGTGPCRCCLRTFVPGVDRRLLFTYRPQGRGNSLTAPGPVFIHASHCDAYVGEGFPEGLRSLPLAFESRIAGSRVNDLSASAWSRPRRRFSACSPPAVLNGFICGMPKPGVSSPASILLNPGVEPAAFDPLRS